MSEIVELDLRGNTCPMNFIKIKVYLEQRGKGSQLMAVLDPDPVASDVCKSLDSQGFIVHKKDNNDTFARVLVKLI